MLSQGQACAGVVAALLLLPTARAQTPDQQKAWEVDRARQAVAEQAEAERIGRERAARRADPMAWVRTLDPMQAGGWEFRSVASDGAWAIFSTTHQLKRSGSTVTLWLRQEFAEPQTGANGHYSSLVERVQYDCKKERTRDLLVIFYGANNIQGSQQTEEGDPKETPWNAIVPGSREEMSYLWACGEHH
jgi:hypothetical protein